LGIMAGRPLNLNIIGRLMVGGYVKYMKVCSVRGYEKK